MRSPGQAAAISRLGLGCSRMGSFNNRTPLREQRRTIEAALELGITVFDTADIYGQGDSERLLGQALHGQRDRAFVTTKFGKRFSAKMRMLRPLKPLIRSLLAGRRSESITARRQENIGADFRPARFKDALDASLRRLGFDSVDGILLHNPPAETVLTPELADVMNELVRSGRARCFGVSCDDLAALKAALTLPGLGLLQLPLDLIDSAKSEGLLVDSRARGVRIFAREVIRLQPWLAPPIAVRTTSERSEIDCVLVGASHPERLQQLVAALAPSTC
jgi:aryl-alcohol dehydrogenase-like predicted oxidoreductase